MILTLKGPLFWIRRSEQESLHINVDKPRANDGNTARRFFSEYEKVAKATGLAQGYLKGFHCVLSALNTPRRLNAARVEEYARGLRERLDIVYPWKILSPSVHKLLYHAGAFVTNFT